ncbi:uncharacterized protein [Paramisgurnus dabryanus]|uniref:uncharacterized protein isoform X2 n=1 Tax=Paramisgurnus dabryanus TaxID=90735 RepID=UPI0031F3D66B
MENTKEANAMVDSVSYMAVVALCNWKIIHSFACGILARTVVCKHTDKMMSSKRPSMLMSGSLSMMNECPSLMMSGHSSVMMSRWLSVMQSKCLSVMMPTGPLLMMSGCSLTTVSWRLSMMMSGRLSVMMSKCPSLMISGGSALKIFGHNIEEFRDVKPGDKGYAGLQNQGATCYLNTVLQILFMTKEFREAAERYLLNNSTINNHIAQLFERLKSGERNIVTTEGITSELKINVHKQDDAAKCLQKILNVVDPKMSEIFQGIKVDTTTCINPPNYHKPLEQVKSFFILSISLESDTNINLQSCFNSYFKSICMRGEGQQIYCKDCRMMMDTDMSCSLEKVPSVLVLHLERFELDYDTMCCIKNHSTVQIPAQLCIEEQVVKDKTGINHMYDLYAIANHFGSLNGGHFYANIKSFENQKWYQFNDSDVNKITGDLDKDLFSEEAYLILYKKSATDSVDPSCNSQEILSTQNMMEERILVECENPEKDEPNDNNNKDPVESQCNFNQAEDQSDPTKTFASVQHLDLKRRRLSEEHGDVVLYKKLATDSATSADPCCHSQEIFHVEDMMEEGISVVCDNPEKNETNNDNNKDPVESPLNVYQLEHQADLTKTFASVQHLDLKRRRLSEHSDVVLYKKPATDSADPSCHSQEIFHEQDMMEEGIPGECENPEKDEPNDNNNKDPVESQCNFNRADITKTFAFFQYLDLKSLSEHRDVVSYKKSAAVSAASESGCNSQIILPNQSVMEEVISHECMNTEKDEMNSDNSDSISEPNPSTHLMSDGKLKSVIVTMSNASERGKKTRNVNIMLLLRCVLLFVFVLLCIQVGVKIML